MKPLIATAVFALIFMMAALYVKEKKTLSALAVALLTALTGISIWELCQALQSTVDHTMYFNDMLRVDVFSLWFFTLMCAVSLLFVGLCARAIQNVGRHVAEYYALLFFILCGVYLLSNYNNLLILFLGVEILSIPQYVLAGSDKRNLKSSEASLKYFLMGAFSTGFMLMGITLLFGSTGSFDLSNYAFTAAASLDFMSLAGVIFIIIALGFKVSAAPMHFWTPDVYDGAPTPFTALMATVVKVTFFIAFMGLFKNSLYGLSAQWQPVLVAVTALTLLIGNVTAVFQQSVKRMLAYSSIAQAGFMLFAVLAINATGMKGLIIYAVAYSVATIALFAVLMKLKDYTYDGFNGLAKKEPFLAFAATICLLSLAGIPLTGGFLAKYYMLTAVMENGSPSFLGLVVFALLMAAVSVYYYFKVIMAMYFKKGEPVMAYPVTGMDRFLLGISALLLVVLGFLPDLFLGWI